MKLFPSKSQWNGWSLTGKASYAGAWLGVLAIVFAVAFYIFPLSAPPSPKTEQITIGSQSPIVNARGSVSVLYQAESTNSGKVLEKLDQMPAALAKVVQDSLNQMDTNRVRVEVLLKEKEALISQGNSNKLMLAQKQKELTEAAEKIRQLETKLLAVVSIQQLSPADQSRVTNAVGKATSVIRARVVRAGTVMIGGGVSPAPRAPTTTN